MVTRWLFPTGVGNKHSVKNIASQTLPNHPCKFGTFVQKITFYPFFVLREPTKRPITTFGRPRDIQTKCFQQLMFVIYTLFV